MVSYIASRLWQAALVMTAVSLIVFVMNDLGGDPVYMMLSPQATAADVEAMRAALGLDQSLAVQYWVFVKGLLGGNLGNSWMQARPVMEMILERLPATLEVALVSMAISLALGMPSGLIAARAPRSAFAKISSIVSIFGISIPPFWLGISFILLFSVTLGWLPSSGRGDVVDVLGVPLSILTLDGWTHLILPALTLALFNAGLTMRLQYSLTRDELTNDYVRTARARGVSENGILVVHALPNTLIPMITFTSLSLGQSIAFAVITETIFAWPGVGKLLIDAIQLNDRPVVLGYLIFIAGLFCLINLLTDLSYVFVDPRVKMKGRS